MRDNKGKRPYSSSEESYDRSKTEEYIPAISGELDDSNSLFHSVARTPRKDRFERGADKIPYRPVRMLAKGAVSTLNAAANYAGQIVMFAWGILLITNGFHHAAKQENIEQGGEGSGPSVDSLATRISMKAMAFGFVGALTLAYAWKKLRGPKKPDYSGFRQFISHIKDLEFQAEKDSRAQRIITNPDPNAPEECDECVSWHTKFITYLSNGADAPAEAEQDLEGLWEAIGYILSDARKRFPFRFEAYEEVLVEQSGNQEDQVEAAEASERNAKAALRRRMRDLTMSQTGKPTESALLRANWGVLANVLKRESVLNPSSSSALSSDASGQARRSVGYDLYNTPLLRSMEDSPDYDEESDSFFASADSFLTVNSEEKKKAATSDWRKIPRDRPRKPPITYRDIAMRLASHVVYLRTSRRTGMVKKEGQHNKAVSILYGLLNGVLTDPFETDLPGKGRNFMTEQEYKSFQLVNLLRPAISDGQWHNWRYFYAQDPVVTDAFKRLSPQKQAWMIFTLMSGNDHGKLLALSILQDERLALTRFASAKDRSYVTSAKDKFNGSSLATFFETYLQEFDDLSEERATSAYKAINNENEPTPEDLENFRLGVRNQMRWQLLWLTENSTGRLSALFNEHTGIAAEILLQLTWQVAESYFSAAEVLQMQTHAQTLFWSMSNRRQEGVLQEMEYGDPDRGSVAFSNSTNVLFNTHASDNINAIKQGVLQSKNLTPLMRLLQSTEPKERGCAFDILSNLFSDRENGIEYQRVFQQLVQEHKETLTSNACIQEFLDWLSSGVNNSDIVRARYMAVMVSVISPPSEDSPLANDRADRTLEILAMTPASSASASASASASSSSSSSDSTLDIWLAFQEMHTAFESEEESRVYRNAFELVFLRKQNLYLNQQQEVVSEASVADDVEAVPPTPVKNDPEAARHFMVDLGFGTGQYPTSFIVASFDRGDIFENAADRRGARSAAELLAIVISYHRHYPALGEQLIDGLCAVIGDPDQARDLRMNLAVVLLFALDKTKVANEQMRQVLNAMAAGEREEIRTYNPDFVQENQRFALLTAKHFEEYGAAAAARFSSSSGSGSSFDSASGSAASDDTDDAAGTRTDHRFSSEKGKGPAVSGDVEADADAVSSGEASTVVDAATSTAIYTRLEQLYVQIAAYLLKSPEATSENGGGEGTVEAAGAGGVVKTGGNLSNRKDAYALLLQVVNRTELYSHMGYDERRAIGDCLGNLIPSGEYQAGQSNLTVVVHRTLFLFFRNEVEGLPILPMSEYASSFMTTCITAGGAHDAAGGLEALIAGITNDLVLSNNFTDEIEPVVMRMRALFLYQLYRQMPSSVRLCGGTNLQQQREGIALQLENALGVADFAEGSSLRQAFQEMGIASVCRGIEKAITWLNDEAAAASQSGERTPLLGQSVGSATPPSETTTPYGSVNNGDVQMSEIRSGEGGAGPGSAV